MMESMNAPPTTSKKMLWTAWVLSALPVLFMLLGGIMSLIKPESMKEGMAQLGYPDHLARTLVIIELVCALLYVIPQTAVLGAVLLTAYLGGAVASHVRVDDPKFVIPIAFGIVVWLGLFFRDARVRALLPLRR